MSSICKSAVSTGSTCKIAGSASGTGRTATATGSTERTSTPVYGVNPELRVTAATDYDATSTYEGAITPASKVYTLKNVGDGPMNWSVVADETWVNFDVSSGTLLPGQEVAVTVTIDNSLLFGTNSATVTFSNNTNGVGDTTRGVELVVTGTLALTLEGRTLASSATLIGFSEFVSPSVPPKKYLTKTLSGEYHKCSYGNFGACPSTLGPSAGTSGLRYSGSINYNPNTGASVNSTIKQAGTISGMNLVTAWTTWVPPNAATSAVETLTLGTFLSRTQTKTSEYNSSDGTCNASYGTYPEKILLVTLRNDLSNEDTEDAAVARMVAAGSWGAWGAISSQGDKKASAVTRAAFTFNSTAAQYRGTRTGLAPNRLFNGQVTLYRRAVGSADPWVEVSTLTFSATTDGSGNFSYSSGNLPTVTGYEYCVFNAVLTS